MDANDKPWAADKVERWPVERLVPYARNSRLHSPAQIDQIAASIREWGWTAPVLASEDGTIICGHARVMAAQKLKITSVPVMVARGWSAAQKKAYVIADNKLAMNSAFDDDMLVMELGDLSEDSFDLGLLGFDDKEIKKLLGEEEPPAPPEEAEDEARNILVIEFQTEAELAAAFEEAKAKGWQCKIMS